MESMERSEPLSDSPETEEAVIEETSAKYLGRWNRLVSTTNWEKGRILSQWRQALLQAGAPTQAYCDEAWSRRVGNVSPQHVGRLRRVYEQFGEAYPQYPGLYWSHFQAALDWHDAEMWLEGAVQNGWSVARMRAQRWEAMGGPPDQAPREEGLAAAEMDEDAPCEALVPGTIEESIRQVRDPEADAEADRGDLDSSQTDAAVSAGATEGGGAVPEAVGAPQPFASLPELPQDLADAFEAFKLAILHHKLAGWREVSCGEVVAVLEALKQLALTRTEA
jgi:hypothetical protein